MYLCRRVSVAVLCLFVDIMSTLYRKYRPQLFSEVCGQEHIKKILQNEVKSGKIAHAFLFSGPRGIGKTTLARILAKVVNCENRKEGEGEPCNNCEACREIIESKSLDVLEMDAATHTQVDKVREHIVENVRFTPSRRKYKIFIIDEAHMLSTSSFNALLKTLEEPPAHAIFILATTEIHKIPETIISRCQRFDFHKIEQDDIIKRIKFIASNEGVELEDEVLQAIAANAGGGLRDAESILGQVFSLSVFSSDEEKKKITIDEASLFLPLSNLKLVKEFVSCLLKKDTTSALKFVSRLGEEGINIRRFMDETIEYLRGLLPEAGIVGIIEKLLEKKQMAAYSKIDELPLELAAVEICGERKEASFIPTPIESENNQPVSERVDPAPFSRQDLPSPAAGKIQGAASVSEQEKKIPVSQSTERCGVDKILKNWHNILNKAIEHNQSLPVVLTSGVPLTVEENILKIGFHFPLYKDRLNKKRETVEKICFEVLGERICVEGVVVKEEQFEEAKSRLPKIKQEKKVIETEAEKIAEVFGGKVVE